MCDLFFEMQDSVKEEEEIMDVMIDYLDKKEKNKASGKKGEDLSLTFKKKREMLESMLLALGKDTSKNSENRRDNANDEDGYDDVKYEDFQ